MQKYKIMIVDDEPDILDLLEKTLMTEGDYTIIKAENGISAVNKSGDYPSARFCFFPQKMMSWIKYLDWQSAGMIM